MSVFQIKCSQFIVSLNVVGLFGMISWIRTWSVLEKLLVHINKPTYLSDDDYFTCKFVQQAHLTTREGGFTLTMTKIRETHWVPRLRRLVGVKSDFKLRARQLVNGHMMWKRPRPRDSWIENTQSMIVRNVFRDQQLTYALLRLKGTMSHVHGPETCQRCLSRKQKKVAPGQKECLSPRQDCQIII